MGCSSPTDKQAAAGMSKPPVLKKNEKTIFFLSGEGSKYLNCARDCGCARCRRAHGGKAHAGRGQIGQQLLPRVVAGLGLDVEDAQNASLKKKSKHNLFILISHFYIYDIYIYIYIYQSIYIYIYTWTA